MGKGVASLARAALPSLFQEERKTENSEICKYENGNENRRSHVYHNTFVRYKRVGSPGDYRESGGKLLAKCCGENSLWFSDYCMFF